jgi:hypothetical protein
MSKQTALEWFKENLKEYSTPSIIEIDWNEFNQLFEQAKEMERLQIEGAYNDGAENLATNTYKGMDIYYNENYGGINEDNS